MAMNDLNYIPVGEDFTSGNMIYSPKKWQDNELIDRVEMNNIEQGIQIALESRTEMNNIKEDFIATIQHDLNDFNTRASEIENQLSGFQDTISDDVDAQLLTQNNNLITTLQQIIGVTDYNIQSLPYTRPNTTAAIDTRLTQLYNEVFGEGSSGTISATSLNGRITNLETAYPTSEQNIFDIIGSRLGSDYYNISNHTWATINNQNGLKDIDTRLDDLNAAIYGNGSSSVSTSLIDQLAALNTAIFGSASGGTSSGSLIDKIEKAMGRSLDLEQGETIDASTGEYSNSLITQINEIKGVLGLDGAASSSSSSSLVTDVNTLLNLAYGYTVTTTEEEDPENPGETVETKTITRNIAPDLENLLITNGYATLYNDFYNLSVTYQTAEVNENTGETEYINHIVTGTTPGLISQIYSQVYNAVAGNAELTAIIESYTNTIEDLDDNAYRGADIVAIGEDNNYYLILKKDVSEADAETVAEIENKNNTYLLLPAIGGGGGTAYDLTASFINTTFPASNTITLGDNYNVTFTWQVLQEGGSAANVDGTLTIRLNNSIVDTLTISSNVSRTINLGDYITSSGRNNFVLTVTNVNAAPKSLYTTIMAYEAVLTSTFNQEIVQTGSTIEFPYLATIGTSTITKVLHIQIDDVDIVLSNNSTTAERQNSVIFNTPSSGSHIIKAWFTADLGNEVIVTSNTLIYGILCGTSVETRITSNFINNQTIEQYNTLSINFMAITPNQDTTRVYIYVNDSTTPTELVVDTSYHTWNYTVTEGAGELIIRMVAGSAEKIFTANVIVNADYDFSMISTGLQLYLNANQRSNSGSNVNIWENQSPLENAPEVTCHLDNFLFYQNVDGWQQDSDGQYFLRLRNKALATIEYPIFNFAFNNNNQITDGMTFEVDFKTSDVTNYDAEILSCYEVNKKNDRNIIFTAQSAGILNGVNLNTYFKEEEKITLAFVINQSADASDTASRLFYIYINGILSAAIDYNDTAASFTDATKGRIIIGSPECTVDIYSIRVYNRALSSNEIIQNWVANTGNYNDKINYYTRNKYDGRVNFSDFIINSPRTPYMVITGPGDWNNADGLNAIPTTKAAGTFTNGIKVAYTDPVHPELSFTTDFEDGAAGIAIQGTSSQEYERKNYKIKLTTFRQNGIIHNKSVTEDESHSRVGYKLRSNSLPTWTFCIKADVASSESVNNTGLVHLYDEIVRDTVLTPPQADDARVRQGVEGYPMVAWYYNSITGEYLFLGKYNFNNDKGTEDVYGFIEGDESWEVGNNEKLLCFFDNSDGWEEWRTAFETRYPDDDSSMTKEKNPYTDEQIADRLAGLKEVVNWVSNTVVWENATTKENVTAASLAAFKAGFEDYFNLPAMLFFYVFTEFFLMVDNRAKNMFLTRYIVNNTRPENADWHTTTDTTTLVSDANGSTANYFGWFSLPYDMDTAIGINNVGVYTFDYHYEDGDYQPNGSPVFNGQKSKLWTAFRQAYADEIRTSYIALQNKLSYTTVENYFEESQNVWSEAIFNEDMVVKYVDWKRNKNDARALPMLLGSKKELRKWWLSNRFKYYNSKYALERATDNVALGLQIGTFDIPISVYADAYVTINVGAQDIAPITQRVLRGETKIFHRVGTSGEGGTSDRVETSISPASSLRTIEGLSQMSLLNADFSRAIKLQVLKIGSGLTTNDRLTTVDVSNNALLHLFDLRNCTSYTDAINLSSCLSLEYAYLSGTKMTNVTLPQGGILTTIQYPTTITNITIINQPYLTNLIIGSSLPADEIYEDEIGTITEFNGTNNYSNINALYLDNAGQVDSLTIVQEMADDGYLYLGDINWVMTTSEFMTLFEKMKDMNGFIGTQPSSESQSYVRGTLYLTTLPSSQDIERIGARFGDIKLYYRDENNIDHEYYTVKFYDPYGAIISEKTQYIAAGEEAVFDIDSFFTEEYLLAYNQYLNSSWVWGAATRQNFKEWDTLLTNVQSDLNIHPRMDIQYRMDYILQTAIEEETETIYNYYFEGATIRRPVTPTFERNYQLYTVTSWQDENGETVTSALKQAKVEVWTAVYSAGAQTYRIYIYNTDINGEKSGEALNKDAPIERSVLTSAIGNTVSYSDLSQYLPTDSNGIAMVGSGEENTLIENRKFQFLNWKPYVGESSNLQVTGNMEILLTYYHVDDIFTNYFLNKLTECDLGDINKIPKGAFFHSTNLRKITTAAEEIGSYCFANFNTPSIRRIFIFTGNDISINEGSFYGLQNSIIAFTGTGQITINNNFNELQNCNILIPNTDLPIITSTSANTYFGFSNFTNQSNNNKIYVTAAAYSRYPEDSSTSTGFNTPYNLISGKSATFSTISSSNANYLALKEEAGI